MFRKTEEQGSCMTVESGTHICAVFNLVIIAIISIINVVALAFLFISVAHYTAIKGDSSGLSLYLFVIQAVGTILLTLFTSVAVTNAVFLFKGVKNRNPLHIKAYFTYGVVLNILSVLGNTIMLVLGLENSVAIGVVSGVYIICAIYSLILFMIRKTYQKFENTSPHYQEILMEAPKK